MIHSAKNKSPKNHLTGNNRQKNLLKAFKNWETSYAEQMGFQGMPFVLSSHP